MHKLRFFTCFCLASACPEYVSQRSVKPLPADLIDSLLIDYKKPEDSINVIKRSSKLIPSVQRHNSHCQIKVFHAFKTDLFN